MNSDLNVFVSKSSNNKSHFPAVNEHSLNIKRQITFHIPSASDTLRLKLTVSTCLHLSPSHRFQATRSGFTEVVESHLRVTCATAICPDRFQRTAQTDLSNLSPLLFPSLQPRRPRSNVLKPGHVLSNTPLGVLHEARLICDSVCCTLLSSFSLFEHQFPKCLSN